MKRVLALTAALLLFVTLPADAQMGDRDGVSVAVTAQGGLLLPVADRIDEAIEGITDGVSEEVAIGHSPALAFGGKVTVWLTEVFGIEGGFNYALSDVEIEVLGEDLCDFADDVGEEDFCDANVWHGNVKGLYRWAPMPDANWGLHFGAGVGVIGHGGDFWEDVDGTTDIGGVLAAGLTVNVTPQIAIRIDVEDYLFSAGFEVDDPDLGVIETDSQFQNDLLFMGGISFNLGGGM